MALIGRDRPAAGTGRSFFSPLTLFLSSVGFLPSILAADWTIAAGRKIRGCRPEDRRRLQRTTGGRRRSTEPTAAAGLKPPSIGSASAGDHRQNRRRPARRSTERLQRTEPDRLQQAGSPTEKQRQQDRQRWRERNLRMRERSQGRREPASLAAYSENNHYTMTAAGHETGAGRPLFLYLSLPIGPPPAAAELSFYYLFLPFRRRRTLFPIPFSPHRSPFHRWVLLAVPQELRVRKRKIFLGMR